MINEYVDHAVVILTALLHRLNTDSTWANTLQARAHNNTRAHTHTHKPRQRHTWAMILPSSSCEHPNLASTGRNRKWMMEKSKGKSGRSNHYVEGYAEWETYLISFTSFFLSELPHGCSDHFSLLKIFGVIKLFIAKNKGINQISTSTTPGVVHSLMSCMVTSFIQSPPKLSERPGQFVCLCYPPKPFGFEIKSDGCETRV